MIGLLAYVRSWLSRSLLLLLGLVLLVAWAPAQHPRAPHPPPGAGLRRLARVPPNQREQKLVQSRAFQNLPPAEQAKALQALRRLNAMPPAQQQRVIRRLRAFGKLNPEQRQGLRQVYAQFRTMSPADKKAFRKAYNQLRKLSPAEREQRLAQPAYQQQFSPPALQALHRALQLELPDELVGSQP